MDPTLTTQFLETVGKLGNKEALRYKRGGVWHSLSYAEFEKQSRVIASGLLELGVGLGEKVSVIGNNRPEWVCTDQAIFMVGGVNVPVYPTLTGPQIAYILNDAQVKVVFLANQNLLDRLLPLLDEVPSLTHVVVYDPYTGEGHPTKPVLSHDSLLEKGKAAQEKNAATIKARCSDTSADNVATIIYTSGTTGEPKGAVLTHRNFASVAEAVMSVAQIGAEDIELSFLPLCHIFERAVYYAMVRCGATVAYAESIDAVAANLGEVKPTLMPSVPRLFEKIHGRVLDKVATDPPARQKVFHWALKVGRAYVEAKRQGKVGFGLALQHTIADRLVFSTVRERTGGKLRLCISGGAPLPVEVGHFFQSIGITVVEGYGLTEGIISINRPNDVCIGTVGPALPGVEVKIAEDGELLARGPSMFKGYYNLPEKTAEAIDPEGWFHTGDIAEFDPKGRIKIVDRKKEIIVMSNGKNVAPQPIENALKASPFIEQVMLIGDRRNFITALIVPNFAQLATLAKELGLTGSTNEVLLRHEKVLERYDHEVKVAMKDFANYEAVKKFALLTREFSMDKDEMTPTLKLKRRVILQNFEAEVEALYAGASVGA